MSAGTPAGARGFARRLIAWQARSGRHALPWQGTRDPYRVWLSEVMLQQTQVSTVVPYYERFLSRFPDVQALARATLDEVLAAWSGLGYYSRGRNLHRTAVEVASVHGGRFPGTRAALEALPGVGRSTAAAIRVFASGAREAILDGNVKRVLARHFGVEGSPGAAAVQKKLWSLAESLLPGRDIERYTQALMDLGASVCLRGRPACGACPVRASCVALAQDRVAELPPPRSRGPLPRRDRVMLILRRGAQVMLERRPPAGIWGGMWSLPEFTSVARALDACRSRFGCELSVYRSLPRMRHGLTHLLLAIRPVLGEVARLRPGAREPDRAWMTLSRALACGIPAPVRALLSALEVPGAARAGAGWRRRRVALRAGRGAAARTCDDLRED